MILADTNVISELARRRPEPALLGWIETVSRLVVSAVTVEELAFGFAKRPSPSVQAVIERVLALRCDVVPVTEAIARRAGALRGRLAARGEVREQSDMLIGATAAVHGLTLATRNVRAFVDCGIDVVDPFARHG